MFLIFDTETTGLPKKWSAPLTDFDNWPRAIQVAWQVHDEKGICVSNQSYIIHPKGFTILDTIQKYIQNKQKEHGYEQVQTPILCSNKLWKKSVIGKNFYKTCLY